MRQIRISLLRSFILDNGLVLFTASCMWEVFALDGVVLAVWRHYSVLLLVLDFNHCILVFVHGGQGSYMLSRLLASISIHCCPNHRVFSWSHLLLLLCSKIRWFNWLLSNVIRHFIWLFKLFLVIWIIGIRLVLVVIVYIIKVLKVICFVFLVVIKHLILSISIVSLVFQ